MLDPVRAKTKTLGFTAAAFAAGLLLASGLELTAGSYASSSFQLPGGSPDSGNMAGLSDAFVSIAESVTPAVVYIGVESTAEPGRDFPAIPRELREFFPMLPPGGESQPQFGAGSGFLISGDGYIVTNNHVIEGANEIDVTLQDRRTFDATVVGRDPTTDIAVIKIEGSNLPTVRLGSSGRARVGEWVVAIGNPLDLNHTVTAGIVSAKGRPLQILQQSGGQWAIEDFIQTDAVINRGNSGGPLVNLRGEVIGVNTAILGSLTGFYTGYGFAVPIDLARQVVEDLIRHGEVRRAALGVQIRGTPLDSEDAEAFGLQEISGVLVQGFPEDSPAERAGLEVGDVIVAVDGERVDRNSGLQRQIAAREPGETVTLDVVRYGERERFRVRLTRADTEPVQSAAEPREESRAETLGIGVTEASQAQASRYGFDQGGVFITRITPYGVLHREGIPPDAVPLRVESINRQPVRTADELRRAVDGAGTGEVLSIILESREGQVLIVNVRVPG
ncbi:MAG: Do family serine endopeptidase [Longimicrobiaceae bacterium]